MEPFTLTKEEFITRAMAGEVFLHSNNKMFYDSSEKNPFRYERDPLNGNWDLLDGKIKQFTLEQPKPKIERRWKYRRDFLDYTEESIKYYPNKIALVNPDFNNWYKVEDCFIDVEIKE